jgi:hypothetical protein
MALSKNKKLLGEKQEKCKLSAILNLKHVLAKGVRSIKDTVQWEQLYEN